MNVSKVSKQTKHFRLRKSLATNCFLLQGGLVWAYPVLTHPKIVTSSHTGRTTISTSQKPKRLHGYTDVHSKLLFLHFKALQQDAQLKKKQNNNKKPQPSIASSQQWATHFLYFRLSFWYSVMWTLSSSICSPPPCPDMPPCLSLSSGLLILLPVKPSLLCLKDFSIFEKSEGIN